MAGKAMAEIVVSTASVVMVLAMTINPKARAEAEAWMSALSDANATEQSVKAATMALVAKLTRPAPPAPRKRR